MPAEIMPELITPEMITPGVAVGGGRYRLLERVGDDERVGATFWRARDSVLDRDVALTTLTGRDGPRCVQAAMAAERLNSPGIARVLDAVSDPRQAGPGLTGLVVTEWINGADLAKLACDAAKAGRTLPDGVIARALSSLANAVDAAHREGVSLGTDHPQRLRIGPDGVARLAFPVASASGQQADDVRGLGASIYLLITGRWPLPDPPAGLPAAPTSSGGLALPPQQLRSTASPTLCMLAMRCLAGGSANGVYAGAAVHQLLEQVSNAEADTMLLTPLPQVPAQEWSPAGSGRDYRYDDDDDRPTAERSKRRKLAIALSVLGVVLLAVFGWLGSQVVDFLAGDTTTTGPSVTVPRPAQPGQGQPTQPGSGSPGPGTPAGPIQAAGIQVFDVSGDPDNANRVSRAIDGNPRSSWKTYDYNQPFPALKSGVGVVVSFAESVKLATVMIDSPSAGSTVEVRTAPAGDAGLAGTTVLGTATLNAGRTEIKLNDTEPSQRILVWITGLSTAGGKNSTQLDELTFLRAG